MDEESLKPEAPAPKKFRLGTRNKLILGLSGALLFGVFIGSVGLGTGQGGNSSKNDRSAPEKNAQPEVQPTVSFVVLDVAIQAIPNADGSRYVEDRILIAGQTFTIHETDDDLQRQKTLQAIVDAVRSRGVHTVNLALGGTQEGRQALIKTLRANKIEVTDLEE